MGANVTFNSHGLSPKGSPLEALREAANSEGRRATGQDPART